MIRTRSRRSAPLCLILIGVALVFATVHAKLFDTHLDRTTVTERRNAESLVTVDVSNEETPIEMLRVGSAAVGGHILRPDRSNATIHSTDIHMHDAK